MRLDDFINSKCIHKTKFAEKLGVTRFTFKKMMDGDFASIYLRTILAVEKETEGLVSVAEMIDIGRKNIRDQIEAKT